MFCVLFCVCIFVYYYNRENLELRVLKYVLVLAVTCFIDEEIPDIQISFKTYSLQCYRIIFLRMNIRFRIHFLLLEKSYFYSRAFTISLYISAFLAVLSNSKYRKRVPQNVEMLNWENKMNKVFTLQCFLTKDVYIQLYRRLNLKQIFHSTKYNCSMK